MRSSVLMVCVVAACGGGGGKKPVDAAVAVDAPDASDLGAACDLVTQSCAAHEKCAWLVTAATPANEGHAACVPDGTKAIGQACTRTAPGMDGGDDCVRGSYCYTRDTGGTGLCMSICALGAGSAACDATHVCSGVFASITAPNTTSGVCDPICDPIADNDFLGSGVRGSACGSSADLGCYGAPGPGLTQWSCNIQWNPNRIHRTVCNSTVLAGDLQPCGEGNVSFINGCAAGYEPLFYDGLGSTAVDCIAMCKPGTCYNAGATGTTGGGTVTCGDTTTTASSNLLGVGPHQCTTSDVRAQTLTEATLGSSGVNGEQCAFSWIFELDASGHLVRSPTSDTVGFCVDHSKYNWPKCDQTGLGSSVNGGHDAAYNGCVDSVTAGAMFGGKPMPHIDLRLPYHRL